jgi:hypothetical protein
VVAVVADSTASSVLPTVSDYLRSQTCLVLHGGDNNKINPVGRGPNYLPMDKGGNYSTGLLSFQAELA